MHKGSIYNFSKTCNCLPRATLWTRSPAPGGSRKGVFGAERSRMESLPLLLSPTFLFFPSKPFLSHLSSPPLPPLSFDRALCVQWHVT